MVGMLGVLAAGAAKGYGEAKNREVDQHNAVAMENMREQFRQEFEDRRFDKQLEASKQQAEMNAKHEAAKYQRDREDKLTDEELKHNRAMEKYGLLEQGKNQRTASSNAARMKAAEIRSKSTGGGGVSGGDKAQSPMGKAIQDMVNMGLAETPQDAQIKIERSGIMKELMKNPMLANDPNRIASALSQWERNLGMQQNQQSGGVDFIFNPKTGKLEPSR